MESILVLICFLGLGLVILILLELRERQRQRQAESRPENVQADHMVRVPVDDECCGRHSVCERESLLTSRPDIVYYDDEELDRLAGVHPDEYTEKDLADVQEVFYTLQDKDVAGWLRSLQLREITIPQALLDEALLIVSERRFANVN